MTMRKKMMKGLFVAALLFMMGFSGCIWGQKAVVVGTGPTCEETLSTGVNGFSDYEVAALLDKALADDRKAECWTPIMEICLNENREVPRRHLAEAVKTFNKRRYEALFHKAVYRYLAEVTRGKADYRPEDRLLLEDYCRFVINNAGSAHDKNLGQAQVMCRKLDPGLYRQFFE